MPYLKKKKYFKLVLFLTNLRTYYMIAFEAQNVLAFLKRRLNIKVFSAFLFMALSVLRHNSLWSDTDVYFLMIMVNLH